MDDDERLLSGAHDPAWAKRVAKMEKQFARADRRGRSGKKTRPARRRGRYGILIVVAVVALAAAGYAAIYHRRSTSVASSSTVPVMNSPAPIDTDPSAATSGAAAGGSAATAATPETVAAGAPGDPFAGSPAAGWPEATRGVIMPAPKPVGVFTAAQMRTALALVHQFILTARTDPNVLIKHDLTSLDAMVVTQELTVPHFQDGSRQSVFFPSRLAPGFVLAAPIRVNGPVTVTYIPKGSLGDTYLEVRANLVWAYALTPHTDTVTPNSSLVVFHENLLIDTPHPNQKDEGIFVAKDSFYISNMDCGYIAQGLLGLPRVNDPSVRPTPSGTILTGAQPYDPRTDIKAGGRSCT